MELDKVKQELIKFNEERDWAQFHDPKNLAEAISIEAGELQELFLWKNKEQIEKEMAASSEFKKEIEDELADVLTYCVQMAITLDVDVEEIMLNKLEKVKNKYPVDKSKGNSNKYTKI